MKKILFAFMGCVVVTGAFAAAGRGRVSMTGQMMAAPRGVMPQQQAPVVETGLAVMPETMVPAIKVDTREKERNACMSNNVGIGNTFVWASRFSNVNNYASMVEDVEQPENNVCFVKVELKSDDSRIDVSDIPAKYFTMGQNITCGSWVDEEDMRQRILDAKKAARVWGTVGGVVGGAGIGVGAMELFGNELIGGKVEGQKSMSEREFARSYVLSLKEEDPTKYGQVRQAIAQFKILCEQAEYKTTSDREINQMCTKFDMLFDLAG